MAKKVLLIVGLLLVIAGGAFWTLRSLFFQFGDTTWRPEIQRAEQEAETQALAFCKDVAAFGALPAAVSSRIEGRSVLELTEEDLQAVDSAWLEKLESCSPSWLSSVVVNTTFEA